MPYYKQLLGTVKIMEELPSPFDNVDVTETYEEQRTTQQESSASSDSARRYSNTPQGTIENIDDHLTEANKDTGSSSGEASETSTVRHTYTKKGNQGVNTYAHDMLEYRETLLNIDTMIINELGDLFIQVY